jgi:hypothetical protein
VLHIRQVALNCVLGAMMCVLQSSDVHSHGARRGLEFKHIDPNLFAFCKKVSEEMRVSFQSRTAFIYCALRVVP